MRISKIFVIIIITLSSIHANITPELADQIFQASPDEMISCIVVMKTTYPYESMRSESAAARIQAYKSIAKESQQPLVTWLSARSSDMKVLTKFWVLNGVCIKAKPYIILAIAKRDDVETVFHNGTVSIAPVSPGGSAPAAQGVEWNVQKIEADKCWAAGHTGEGVIIGIIDSGVDYLHPALKDKWSGHWHDAINGRDTPYDDFHHGTHCAGTILGGDGTGPFEDDIGVAPGARYAAAKGLNSGGTGSYRQLIECIEFMADLKATVNIKAVSCSWNNSSGGGTVYWDAFTTLRSLGVLPIISNGNNGLFGASSVQSPADYPFLVGVGATNKSDKIFVLSSLGPTTEKSPYNDKSQWIRSDWNYIKPNISAPGEQVRSCAPNGEYKELSGTSMAAPHVCGAVALICQKNQDLTPEMIYDLLIDNTDKPADGGTYPNNTFGWGRLNVYKALGATPTAEPQAVVSNKKLPALTFSPNPFRVSTAIRFMVPAASDISLCVYSVSGKVVAILSEGRKTAGLHTVHWNGRDIAGSAVASGIYYIGFTSKTHNHVSKIRKKVCVIR